jgi:hypothetical protein
LLLFRLKLHSHGCKHKSPNFVGLGIEFIRGYS